MISKEQNCVFNSSAKMKSEMKIPVSCLSADGPVSASRIAP